MSKNTYVMSRTGFGKTYATVQKMLTLLLKLSLGCLSLRAKVNSGTEKKTQEEEKGYQKVKDRNNFMRFYDIA